MGRDDTRSPEALVGQRIREELGRRRVTRQWLADHARISLSTLEKGLAGQRAFSTATLVRIEEALGVDLRPRQSAPSAEVVAPAELGAYARAAVRWLEGDYITLRPSFETTGSIYAYRTRIFWDDATSHLCFAEHNRRDADYAQHGDVSLPHQSGQIYLITRESGQFRLAILSRPTIEGVLHGLLTTLQAPGGSRLVPLCCPLTLVPASKKDWPLGIAHPSGECFSDMSAYLARVEGDGFARLLSGTAAT